MDIRFGAQNTDEHALKVGMLRQIAARLEAEGLTQAAAAERLGISQPDVSRMLSGNFRQFSVERLMRFLVALGQEIEIRVRPAQISHPSDARITVTRPDAREARNAVQDARSEAQLGPCEPDANASAIGIESLSDHRGGTSCGLPAC